MDQGMRELAMKVLEEEIFPELKRVLVLFLSKCSSGEDLIRYLDRSQVVNGLARIRHI